MRLNPGILVGRQKLAECGIAYVERLAAFAANSTVPACGTVPDLGTSGHDLPPTVVACDEHTVRDRESDDGDLHLPVSGTEPTGQIHRAVSVSAWER